MVSIVDIVNTLTHNNIYIFVENGKLKTRADQDALTPDLVSLIKNNKAELIEHLSQIQKDRPENDLPSIHAINDSITSKYKL